MVMENRVINASQAFLETSKHWLPASKLLLNKIIFSQAISLSNRSCPAGKISRTVSATSCTTCGLGKYSPTDESTECLECPVGYYQDGLGKTSCRSCLDLIPAHFQSQKVRFSQYSDQSLI